MSSSSLMKHKSAYTKRRLIITFIMLTILAVSVMTGFSNGLKSDPTIYTADGDRIVMWEELPESGTPEDYDLLTNLRFTAQKLYTAPYYRGETIGKVIANVGLGIKYTQNVHNTRYVKGDVIFAQAISTSSLKSVAEQKFYKGETVLYRPSASINGENVAWADNVGKFEKEDYFKAYGVIPNELVKHCIDQDTILSVKDENALTQRAAQSKHDEEAEKDAGVEFEIPNTLVADADGLYVMSFELDAAESTKYYRNEVRTLGGADQNPEFHSAKVTVTIDRDWNPVKVVAEENYDIAIPVLGAMNCTSTMTETFADIGDLNGEIPEYDYFMEHIDSADDIQNNKPSSPADYLASAFAGYLDGSHDLDLAVDASIGGVDINGLKLSLNIGTMNVKAKLGNLSAEYTGDRVYITLNDIKGYFTTDKFASLMQDPSLAPLLSGLGGLDFDELLGDDILTTVFGACEMTSENGITCIRLPFDLSDDISIDASLYIADEGMELMQITGTVKAFGIDVTLDAKPAKLTFPAVNETYKCLDGVIDFIPDAMNTALGATYGIKGTVSAMGTEIGIDAYIDRTDSNNLKVDAVVTALGANIGVKYTDGAIFASLGGTNVRATLDDLPALIELIKSATGFDASSISGLTSLLPSDAKDIVNMLRSLDVDGNTLSAKLRVAGIPVSLSLSRENGKLSRFTFDLDAKLLGKELKASADLALSSPTRREVTAPDKYIEASELIDIISTVTPLIGKDGYAFDINADIYGVSVVGSAKLALDGGSIGLNADLNIADVKLGVTLAENNVYVNIDNKIKLTCGTTQAELLSLIDNIRSAVPELDNAAIEKVLAALDAVSGILSGNAPIDINAILEKIAITDITAVKDGDDSVTTVTVKAFGASVTVDLTAENNVLASAALTANEATGGITLTSTDAQRITVPPASDYVPLSLIASYAKPIADFAVDAAKAKTLMLDLSAKLTTADGNYIDITCDDLTIALGGSIAVGGTIRIFENTDAVTEISVKFVDGTLYVKAGGVALSIDTTTDIDRLTEIIGSYLPEYLRNEISNGFGAVTGIDRLIARFKAIAAAETVEDVINGLFAEIDGLTSSDSAVKSVLNMISVGVSGDDLAIIATLSGISLTAIPELTRLPDSDAYVLSGVRLLSNVMGMDLSARLGISLSENATAITLTAEEKADYVPVMQFVEVVNDAIGTFTKRNGNDITFEVGALDFTYAPIAAELPDGATANNITVKNVDGKSALIGKLTQRESEDGKISYSVSLEAHITLEMTSLNEGGYGILTIELYLMDMYPDLPTAYLYYHEKTTGYGELVSIDAQSVLEILAAVMDIIGVDDKTVQSLVGAYRQPIDTSLFDSMDIQGLDGLKSGLDTLALALDNVKTAVGELTAAIDLINTAGNMDELKNRLDDTETTVGIKTHIDNALSALKSIAPSTDDSDAPDEPETPDGEGTGAPIDGSLFKNITGGVEFGYDATKLWADVNNRLTTGHDRNDAARIAVEHENNVINGIVVSNLDAKTAMVNMDTSFTSGQEVSFESVETVLAKATGNTTYSDFANVKRLLFDIMNTANLKEFEIGGGANDTIHLGLPVVSDIDIKYSVKVKLFDKTEQLAMGLEVKDTDPEYKTGAAVELFFDGAALNVLPKNASTRLYFFDNVLYLDGIKSHKIDKYGFLSASSHSGSTCERVYQKYTVDEFTTLISTDIKAFLKEFVFRLIPLTSTVTDLIVKNIDTSGNGSMDTIAKIFKGYTYDGAEHSLTIGLKELAGNNSLSDLNISFTGANDADDETNGISNNYIASAHVDTSFVSIVTLTLDASLKAPVEYIDVNGNKCIKSSGLTATHIADYSYSAIKHSTVKYEEVVTAVKDNAYTTLADLLLGEAMNNPQFA